MMPLGAPAPEPRTEPLPAPWGDTKVVGKPLPRIDAWERVSGTAVYGRDLAFPDMLHAAVLRCPHGHAKVKKVDTRKAEKMPGVRAVLGPDSELGGMPWYRKDKTFVSSIFDPHCRFHGEEVAVVAAETPHQAFDALRAIEVEYEVLPAITDMEKATSPGAPVLHEGGNRQPEIPRYTRGDVDKGFAEAAAVVEMTFRTACELHTPMEVHGSVARWDGDQLTVWDSAQGVYAVRDALADMLHLPLASVRVISKYLGGGFGSKLGINKHTVIAAVLARQTRCPVKLFVTREDTMLAVGNRPPTRLTLKAGATKDGRFTAFELEALGTGGAYPTGATSGYLVADLYQCPNVRIRQDNVYIDAGPGRAFRAPGFPSTAWALEQVVDALALRLGLDALELRLKNIPAVSQLRQGTPYTSTGLERCLREGAQAFGYEQARARAPGPGPVVRGVGMAAGMWGYEGEDRATNTVTLLPDGSVTLVTGAADIGTGTRTALAMVVAEELTVPLERITVDNADTGVSHYSPGSGGSQTILANTPSVRAAALEVKRKLLALAAKELADESVRLEDGAVVTGAGKKVPFAKLESLTKRRSLVAVGERHPHPAGKVALPFSAQFAEVEVDTRTGEVRVLRMLGTNDSGRVINRLTYENQVHGGIVMGLGFALSEERVLDDDTGRVLTDNWHDYQIPTTLDAPPTVTCLPIDPKDADANTTGTKGLGEPAHVPTAAAIANAIHHATGVRPTETPVTPARMLALLAQGKV
jgi:xanthine dehydrogenase YagR molybdenum-binding subunit